MATPNTEKASPGYFDINPRSSSIQTPYFDAPKPQSPVQTPFYDCEPLPTPFIEQLQLHHGHNIQPKLHQSQNNNHDSNITSSGVDPFFATNSSPLGFPLRQSPFQGGAAVAPSWVQNGAFDQRFPLQRRQTLNPKGIVPKKPHSMPAGLSPFNSSFEEYSADSVAVIFKQQQSSLESPSPQKIILLLDLRTFSILSSISRKPGPFTCPTPIIEMAGINPFFSNIRQNMEMSSGITETIPVRVPQGINLDRSKLPKFILDVVYGDNGDRKLAEAFHEIERDEQRRLQSLMLHNSNQPTTENPFSISAGMEKGTKNRYHNIWPYDHARVKIGECKEGDCDYVNASYVQADGCNKRYIATQGPLPATYEDFWKVIWEQNSRIIVMLTKEQEAGRIQCHRYWAECTANPCQFGPLELLLISEHSSHSVDGATENGITVRKFRLRHRNHPELPAREITQLHFLGWPDFGIPDSPRHILNLIETANSIQLNASKQCDVSQEIGPMVVHCSAGCGRTGAFCTIDTVLSLFHEKNFDTSKDIIQETIARFREQRLSMVKTLRQYVFCYEAILWKLSGAA
ncbi:13639_t:CDS:2 [Acaulospora colombiana]|uniref:13639_t:CDS:1 n=1 Tax=Acaulospora colombiana TaxID=27376 RepID=A0ACA9KH31_9GLOM|nr:13639_t:CDS:2 [Acaulospora colombiana]